MPRPAPERSTLLRRLLPVVCAAAALVALPTPAPAHEGNPDFISTVRSVTPPIEGFAVSVVNGDDSLEAVHRGGATVTVLGYKNEPYIRMDPDGTVSVNLNSEAYYVNQDRYHGADVPAGADIGAAPEWKQVASNGRFNWHDHRMHYMVEDKTPTQVENEGERTKIFDWKVFARAGGQRSTIAGDLYWRGRDEGSAPVGAYIGLGALVLISGALVVVVRRRRGRLETGSGAEDGGRGPQREAW